MRVPHHLPCHQYGTACVAPPGQATAWDAGRPNRNVVALHPGLPVVHSPAQDTSHQPLIFASLLTLELECELIWAPKLGALEPLNPQAWCFLHEHGPSRTSSRCQQRLTLTHTLLVLLSISNVQTADSLDSEPSNPPSNPPSPSRASSSERDSDGTGTSGSGQASHASQTATDSDVSSLTSVDSGLPSGVEKDSDSASDNEIVWAKGARGVWGLANVFANGKLYFTRDVPEANCLPQGLEPPAKPAAKPAPKVAKPRAKPSKRATKPVAQVAAKPADKPAAGEPIPVAPVDHVQLFKVKHSHQKKWHTQPVAQQT